MGDSKMRPTDEIKKLVKNMSFKAGPEMDNDLWTDTTRAHDQSQKTEWSQERSLLRRITMNTRTMKIVAVALIALAILLPLSYGASKIIKFVVEEFTIMYGVDDENTKYITAYAFNPTVKGDCINNKEDAKQAEKEILQLIKEGKAEQINPSEYKAILSNGGEVIYDTLGIPIEILGSENRKEKIQELTDEIEDLKKAGEFERTFLDVVKSPKGRDVYIYKTRYTLSNGVTITLNSGYGHKVEEIKKE